MSSAFNIDQLTDTLYAESCPYSASDRRPLIGISGNYADDRLQLLPGYIRSLEAAGADVVVVPPRRHPDAHLFSLLNRLDALLLSGGADVNPLFTGEDPLPRLGNINSERDAFELALVRMAYNRRLPLFGICRGIQVIALALGGKVMQDMATALPHTSLLKHSQEAARSEATHYVEAEPDSAVSRLLGTRFAVNSFHHQAVAEPGPLLRVTARSADGIIEAIESTDFHPVMGVQWHPECFLPDGDACMLPLFRHFVGQAERYRAARQVHHRVLTLDSHCDTPMFFDRDIDLCRRDPQLLVDFVKMREGLLDASIMVAYLPQGELTPEAYRAATVQADSLISQLEARVAQAPGVCMAATPAELYAHKQAGLLSIMRGIENGYALGHDLTNVARFRKRGVVYITLCHNGDNDICDSARRSQQLHGGLSDFGCEVVREMNRVGLMVDLSHAAESSFYDALRASRTPIVCSHASSRALCNHPRNLTDDQLRALAAAGGVAQVTLYHGFLRLDTDPQPATVADGVAHLMHFIDVAGIDAVGIGTDFDGDGGVPGCASASDLTELTLRLQAEGLTTADLQKVWGGNFLRVMQQCQDCAEPGF